ncbi:MAG: hypothetical protein ACOYYJ_07300 [Chloroflexota bacterium]
MKLYGLSALSDFWGDFIVYRNLKPADQRLPALDDLRGKLSLLPGVVPRKNESDYARVVVEILEQARKLTAPGADIRRVIFLGDTRLLDSTAFANICAAGGWPGIAFIGAEAPRMGEAPSMGEAPRMGETSAPPNVELETMSGGQVLYLSNRWAALDDTFREFVAAQGFPIDEHTALLIDMDKTALGARGRNAAVIDNVRVQAVEETVAGLLGEDFDPQGFRAAYDLLVQPEFHPFTGDNQDYLAYTCLVLGSGLEKLDRLAGRIRVGEMREFRQFIAEVDARSSALSPSLAAIHKEIFTNVRAGDPTPFKPFRYNEFRITSARMGCLPDEAPLAQFLGEEILLTREVRDLALDWRARGALVFGLSDKPDEASLPTPELAAQGYVPLHRKQTHTVGV